MECGSDANRQFKSKGAIMSTNSKFLRNRISKLIGKPIQLKENIPNADTKKQLTRVIPGSISTEVRQAQSIRLQSKQRVTHTFACYSDTKIYRDFSFPSGRQMHYDNDQESNFHQIHQDIRRGYCALKKELDCSLSEFTLQSFQSS